MCIYTRIGGFTLIWSVSMNYNLVSKKVDKYQVYLIISLWCDKMSIACLKFLMKNTGRWGHYKYEHTCIWTLVRTSRSYIKIMCRWNMKYAYSMKEQIYSIYIYIYSFSNSESYTNTQRPFLESWLYLCFVCLKIESDIKLISYVWIFLVMFFSII